MSTQNNRYPVSEDAPERTWTPERKCRQEVMDEILDMLIKLRNPTFRTFEITESLHRAHPEWRYGTCSAYVSGAMLAFREAGWVRTLGREGHTYVWEVDA